MSKLSDLILSRQDSSFNHLSPKRAKWDEYEDIFFNKLSDRVSGTTKSQVFDPRLSTLAIERSNRVMAQIHTGKVRGISSNDIVGEKLLNLTLDKYVLPNANAQFNFLTKMRMVDLYSNIYGNFFTFNDWDVRQDGYIGPDTWLLNIRDVFHQVGAVSLNDSDYVIIRTWRPLSYFENLKPTQGYKNVGKIVAKLKELSGDKSRRSSNEKSKREENEYPEATEAKAKGFFEVFSMYERDRWADFVVDGGDDGVFRDFENPHPDGDIPVKCKYSIPLIDDFMGMGDFERGKSMQYTLNSVWNLYLDAVKISIFPPTLINKDSIASASSIKHGPAAKWLMRGGNLSNAAKTLDLSPQGVMTFNNTQRAVIGALLNSFGTTDTSIAQETDAGFGKTPQALKMQQARENTRDNADRFYMEQYLKDIMKSYANLITQNMTGDLKIRLFEKELDELGKLHPEMKKMYDTKTGQLSIKKGKWKENLFDYEVVSGSTYAIDQKQQQANLAAILEMYMRNPELVEAKFKMEGKEFKLGELLTRIISSSGIQDWDKIIVDGGQGGAAGAEGGPQEQDAEQITRQAEEQFMQGLKAMMEGSQANMGNAAMGAPNAVSQTPPMR